MKQKTTVHKGWRGRGQEGVQEGRGFVKRKKKIKLEMGWDEPCHLFLQSIYIPFLWRAFHMQSQLALRHLSTSGKKTRRGACVAPQLPHEVKRVGGKKKSNAEVNISTSCFFTRLFSSICVSAPVLFTAHRHRPGSPCFYIHTSLILSSEICVSVFLQPASDSLLFCLYVYLRACVLVCLVCAPYFF